MTCILAIVCLERNLSGNVDKENNLAIVWMINTMIALRIKLIDRISRGGEVCISCLELIGSFSLSITR